MKLGKKGIFNLTLLLVMGSYMGMLWWDVNKVDRFCGAVDIGLKVSYLRELAIEHGVKLQNFSGISAGKVRAKTYATSSMGGSQRICSIEHDFEYVQGKSIIK